VFWWVCLLCVCGVDEVFVWLVVVWWGGVVDELRIGLRWLCVWEV